LCSRSDDKAKGINKLSFIEYSQLPGVLGERLFMIMNLEKTDYLSLKEFITGLLKVYLAPYDSKI
jgi:hypothetical protein